MCLLALLAIACVPVSCGGDDDGNGADADNNGSVTIVTDIDFTSEPFKGTFEVTEGSEELGCSGGTFVDDFVDDDLGEEA